MAAIPMQGFAAASMLFCGQGMQHQHGMAQTEQAAPAHDHSQHGHADASHGHAKAADTRHGVSGVSGVSGTAHKCSICAACCNSVAILGLEQAIALEPAPQSALAEPLVFIQTLPPLVPDKPPRA